MFFCFNKKFTRITVKKLIFTIFVSMNTPWADLLSHLKFLIKRNPE